MKAIALGILVVLTTQTAQVLLIMNNQETNPLLYAIPLDALMLVSLFAIAERS